MHVAFALSALQAGGAERVVADLTRAVVERGWRATILSFDRPGDPIYHSYDPRVQLRRLALPPAGGGLRAAMQTVKRVTAARKILRSHEFDVVISFLTKINTVMLLAAMGTGVPIIVSERNNPDRQAANPLWKMTLNRLYPRAAGIVMQTERSLERLPARIRRRATVIANPSRTPPFAPDGALEPTLTAVGRLTEQKGFDLLIRAFAGIADRYPEWRLLVWGEGPDRAALEQQIRDLNLADRVQLPGNSAIPGSWIESATVFVLPSRYEGWPNALAEAMGAGLPVVAFDCDFGPSEMIAHGESGLLVAAENIGALAAAISAMIEQPELRQKLGREAIRAMDRFSGETITTRWLQLIKNSATSS